MVRIRLAPHRQNNHLDNSGVMTPCPAQRLLARLAAAWLLLAAWAALASGGEGEVIYVDQQAGGQGDGTSWQDAYRSVSEALAEAQPGDTVWVAEGVYRPDQSAERPEGTGDRQASFELKDGVWLLGGFGGYEVAGIHDPWAKDPSEHETILCGDIGTAGVAEDNSYHILTANSVGKDCLVKGFTIRRGYSQGYSGAGLLCMNASPTIRRCRFQGHHAVVGGAVGGWFSSTPAFINCRFEDNRAQVNGGAVYLQADSHPEFENCLFRGNSAGEQGGGLYIVEQCSPILINCSIVDNQAGQCGGLYCNGSCSPVLTNCILWGNRDQATSGALSSQLMGVLSSYPVVRYSCVEYGQANQAGTWESIITTDPLLTGDDGQPTQDSPCLDRGLTEAVRQDNHEDIRGLPRISGEAVDIGAWEYSWPETDSQVRFLLETVVAEGQGRIVPSRAEYAPGEVVELHAEPCQGYRTVYWLGSDYDDWDGDENVVTMDGDRLVEVGFAPRVVTLRTIVEGPQGQLVRLTPSLAEGGYSYGTVVELQAIAAGSQYGIVRWQGSDDDQWDGAYNMVTVRDGTEVIASFAEVVRPLFAVAYQLSYRQNDLLMAGGRFNADWDSLAGAECAILTIRVAGQAVHREVLAFDGGGLSRPGVVVVSGHPQAAASSALPDLIAEHTPPIRRPATIAADQPCATAATERQGGTELFWADFNSGVFFMKTWLTPPPSWQGAVFVDLDVGDYRGTARLDGSVLRVVGPPR